MIHCSDVSLETKFSERKVPHGSEYSFISRQKVLSARRAGTCAAAGAAGIAHTTASAQRTSPRRMLMERWRTEETTTRRGEVLVGRAVAGRWLLVSDGCCLVVAGYPDLQ